MFQQSIPGPFTHLKKEAREYECYETDKWAAERVLDVELLTSEVIDPCVGPGMLSNVLKERNYSVKSYDIFDWGYQGLNQLNFLEDFHQDLTGKSVFLNPPFSKADEFVIHCLNLNAQKIVCFQRFAWWESAYRKPFWDTFPPARVIVCASRADCWRIDIPYDERRNGSTIPHAWFIWEKGAPSGTVLDRIYMTPKQKAEKKAFKAFMRNLSNS